MFILCFLGGLVLLHTIASGVVGRPISSDFGCDSYNRSLESCFTIFLKDGAHENLRYPKLKR